MKPTKEEKKGEYYRKTNTGYLYRIVPGYEYVMILCDSGEWRESAWHASDLRNNPTFWKAVDEPSVKELESK